MDNAIQRNILQTVESQVDGRAINYVVEHEHVKFPDGKHYDSLYLNKVYRDEKGSRKNEIINLQNFYDLQDYTNFTSVAKEFYNEAFDLSEKDMNYTIQQSMKRMNSMKR